MRRLPSLKQIPAPPCSIRAPELRRSRGGVPFRNTTRPEESPAERQVSDSLSRPLAPPRRRLTAQRKHQTGRQERSARRDEAIREFTEGTADVRVRR